MKPIDNFVINRVDLGKLIKVFEKSQQLLVSGGYEEYFTAIVDAIKKSQIDFTEASKVITQSRISQNHCYCDIPTDIIWITSLVLVMRTIGILESKARDQNRDQANRDIHKSLENNYLDFLKKLIEEKDKYVALFPYKNMDND